MFLGVFLENLQKRFQLSLFLSLVIKFGLALMIPITGDEAYYILWGKFPQFGYYDQPPMIGWWLAALQWIVEAGPSTLWFMRLPAVVLSTFVALAIFWILKGHDQRKAILGAELFLWNPVTLMPVILSTDTPLLYFTTLALVLFLRGIQSKSFFWFSATGVILGLGFLSKYFAVLAGGAFALSALWMMGWRQGGFATLAMLGAAFPFVWFHLDWNSKNCWINFTFNLNTRNTGEGFQISNVITFLVFQFYMVSPLVLWAALKRMRDFSGLTALSHPARVGIVFYVVAFSAFFVSSLKAAQGFHWMFLALPGLYLAVIHLLSSDEMDRWLGRMRVWCGIHLVAFLVLFFWPQSEWEKTRVYSRYVLFRHGDEVAQGIEKVWPEVNAGKTEFLLTDGYTEASLLHFFMGRHVSVFNGGTKFGRLDDTLTDFKQMAGRDLRVFTHGKDSGNFFARFFDRVDHQEIEVRGARFHLWVGRGFHYEQYRDDKLAQGIALFYPKPSWSEDYVCPVIRKYF